MHAFPSANVQRGRSLGLVSFALAEIPLTQRVLSADPTNVSNHIPESQSRSRCLQGLPLSAAVPPINGHHPSKLFLLYLAHPMLFDTKSVPHAALHLIGACFLPDNQCISYFHLWFHFRNDVWATRFQISFSVYMIVPPYHSCFPPS